MAEKTFIFDSKNDIQIFAASAGFFVLYLDIYFYYAFFIVYIQFN